MAISEITIHKVTPERLKDFLIFFEGEAFKDNPEWGTCFCQCYFADHKHKR